MKIAMIIPSLYSQGAEYVVATLARELSARGHIIELWLSQIHRDIQENEPGRKPFSVPSNIVVRYMPSRRARYNILAMRRLVKNVRPDVVLVHATPYALPLALATLGLRYTKIIHVEHLSGIGVDSCGRRVETVRGVVSWFRNWLMRRYIAIFTVSNGNASAIARMTNYPRNCIYTVYNPVVDDVFYRKAACEPNHPWLRDKTGYVFVAAGAFCSFKNHQLLLRAFSEVVKYKPESRLIIYGEGRLRTEYETLIKRLGITSKVSLPGFTNNLPAELKVADCFVVSSLIESFSVVLVEALAVGIKVLSTDCPYGPPEILQGGKYGRLIKNNDVDEMAHGMLDMINGKGVISQLEAWRMYTGSVVAERYEYYIKKALSL